MTAQDQRIRAAFEAWARRACYEVDRHDSSQYASNITEQVWQSWQAARALPEGMEPVECQWRMRPDWDNKHPWTDWAKCSPASAAAYERTPILHNWIYEVRRFYAAAQVLAMGRVPPGWQAVPVEPTQEMVRAGYYQELKAAQRAEMYRAMLAAAPRPPAAQEESNAR